MIRRALLPALLLAAACWRSSHPANSFLYVWAGDSAGVASDFLAVIDADTGSAQYGQVVASLPTGVSGTQPHHTEDFVATNGHLLANGHAAGRTWLFDLTTPRAPKILAQFGDVGGYRHPHSFFRTPDGNVLATFQYRADSMPMGAGHAAMAHDAPSAIGGLVLMTEVGSVVRAGSAADRRVPDKLIYPYSVLQLPAVDRAISTTTDMNTRNSGATGEWIQFWRLSDLTLLRSLHLPAGPRGDEQKYSGEPKLLADGKSVYVHTFNCGLYLVQGAETAAPTARLVHTFDGTGCGVPVQTGHWWIATVPSAHALVTLDVSDPEHPREMFRLTLGDDEEPHWLAIDTAGRRLVVNSSDATSADRIYLVDFDPATGDLALDRRFRDGDGERPGVPMKQRTWPHGWTGTAKPHGSVFSR